MDALVFTATGLPCFVCLSTKECRVRATFASHARCSSKEPHRSIVGFSNRVVQLCVLQASWLITTSISDDVAATLYIACTAAGVPSQPRGSFDTRWKDVLQHVEIDSAGYTGPETFLPTDLAGLGSAAQVSLSKVPAQLDDTLCTLSLNLHN